MAGNSQPGQGPVIVDCPILSIIRIFSFKQDGVGYLMQITEDGIAYLTTGKGF